jgi:hypothetical protein
VADYLPAVVADYNLTNLGAAPLPCLWSQHCLPATRPGDRIVLSGHQDLRAGTDKFVWPIHQGRDLRIVGPLDEGFALKAYLETNSLQSGRPGKTTATRSA